MKIRLTKLLSGTTYQVGYFIDAEYQATVKQTTQQNAATGRIKADDQSSGMTKQSQDGVFDPEGSLSTQSSDPSLDFLLPGASLLGDTQGLINLSDHVGGHFSVRLKEALTCYECGQTFKKLYRGFCYPCLVSAASADACWMNPEHCHHAQGTCRSEEWADARCFTGHCVYLAYTSDFKVGITSTNRLAQRWIEQGAHSAIKLCQTNSRRTAGLIEKYFKQFFKDRTNNAKLANHLIGGSQIESSQILDVAQTLKVDHEQKLADWLAGRAPAMRYQWSPLKAYFFDHPKVPEMSGEADQPNLTLWKQPRDSAQPGRLLGVQGKVMAFDRGYVSIGSYELELLLLS